MKFPLIVLFCIVSFSLKAQDLNRQHGYFNITDVGYSFGKYTIYYEEPKAGSPSSKVDYNSRSFVFRTINGVFVNSHISIGLGLGFLNKPSDLEQEDTFLFFLDGRYYLGQKKNSLFAYCDLGGGFATVDLFSKGGYFGAGFGYKLMPVKYIATTLSIGYESLSNYPRGSTQFNFKATAVKLGFLF